MNGKRSINENLQLIDRRLHQLLVMNVWEYLRKWLPLGFLIGIIGGMGAMLFEVLLQMTYGALYSGEIPWYIILFVPALGGLLAGIIIRKFAPEAAGHGTDSVINALHHKAGRLRPVVVPVKVVASVLTIGTGGSAGREGPIAQIGAGLASFLSIRLKLSRSDMKVFVVAGMAAGFSAIFKAPLGAAVFAMEVPYKNDLEHNAVIPSIISSVVSYLIFVPFYGTTPIFQVLDVTFAVTDIPLVLLVGVMAGLVGLVFILVFYFFRDYFLNLPFPFEVRTALGGLAVGIIGLFLPEVLGLGNETIQMIIAGSIASIPFLIVIMFGKILATSLTVGSGGSGGVFFPSLMIGGALGGALGFLFHMESTSLFVVVGMGAMMSGVTKTPVATSIMITEMVGGYIVLIPLMIASAISYIVTGNLTIYEAQIAQRSFSLEVSCLGELRVKDIMTSEVEVIPDDFSITQALNVYRRNPHYCYPVVSERGRIIGMAPSDRIEEVSRRLPTASILQVIQSHFESIPADQEALEAFEIMNAKQISRMVVVDPDTLRVVGILTRMDILSAMERMDERHHEL